VWRLGVAEEDEVSQILAGRADLAFRELPPELLRKLAASHAGQVRIAPRNGAYFMTLNTTTAPFDDVRVRRALNLAVDRRVIERTFGGIGSSTCQVLPPNFPGYVPYCPFTRHPDGTWRASDVASATELVRASGTAGSRVTVWATPEYAFGIPVPVGRYFVHVLRRLGYRARLEVVGTRHDYFAATLDPARGVQVSFAGWVSDYPVESGFIVPVLSCAVKGHSGSGFCDPLLDRRMAKASRLQASDLAAAHRSWTSIEHELTDAAPWVPLVNRSWVNLVSERVGDFQVNPEWGPLIDQMWVQ
jgi:peptide/nickel transport system substrate-binding protein